MVSRRVQYFFWLRSLLASTVTAASFGLSPTTLHIITTRQRKVTSPLASPSMQKQGASDNCVSGPPRDTISDSLPRAQVVGSVSESGLLSAVHALQRAGFVYIDNDDAEGMDWCRYRWDKTTGMLKLLSSPESTTSGARMDIPRWIPIVSNMENVLVRNGWSFLDPDESEPMYAFDVDSANQRGMYQPKWHDDSMTETSSSSVLSEKSNNWIISKLGFDIRPLGSEQILPLADNLKHQQARTVLLQGGTDPPYQKITNNGKSFNGSVNHVPPGIFACAVGGLPLFSTLDLSPTTATSGWLTFSRPLSLDHVIHVQPVSNASDQRVEVICARSKCHVGHYFGTQEGYCINASALNFISKNQLCHASTTLECILPVSWRAMEQSTLADKSVSPSISLLYEMMHRMATTETVLLGAGCFWHVEFALRRLPGVVRTQVGYAGGTTPSAPTYEDVCQGQTGHAEVVRVEFIPAILPTAVLWDCFLSMHDPTKFRAHGKHAPGTGQYRSCIFVTNTEMEHSVREAMQRCQDQLEKDLSTELHILDPTSAYSAEDRHQRHNERRQRNQRETRESGSEDLSTLMPAEWLQTYGKRRANMWA